MQVLRTLHDLASTPHPVYVAIGVFDGVHLGHQRVIGQARDDAQAAGGRSVVLTFDPHPIRILRPDHAPVLLTSTPHKLSLIEQLGVDACLLLTFDKTLADTAPEQFVSQLAAPVHQLREICVGTRFRFGHNRAGDVTLLAKLAAFHQFTLKEITSVHTAAGEMVSSTALRQHVLSGNLQCAAEMLGRPLSLLGVVKRGDGIGRQLGFPTANVGSQNEALPPNGVYAANMRLGTELIPGVVNIGVRPTFQEREHNRLVEAHLFDFNRDIYGQELEVIFVKKLRDEQKFDSVESLRRQIAADAQSARQVLS